MKFIDKGNTKVVEFEETDTDSEKRIVEHGLRLLRDLLQRIREVK